MRQKSQKEYGYFGIEQVHPDPPLIQGKSVSRIDEVLKMVHLEDAKHKKAKDYSLGMKQRLGIAMALLNQPDFLILDEPTNGLDPSGIQEIRELIKQLPQMFNVTVFVSSHFC
nr:ATP-binding cassette domain-containing protein [Thermoactinomyces sp. CICC 24226]